MRAPPPLRWHCTDARGWRTFTAGCFALAVAAAAAWALAHAEVGKPWHWLGPLCLAIPALIYGWRFVPVSCGTLERDGAGWTWHGDGATSAIELREPRLAIDLDTALLLKLCAATPNVGMPGSTWVVVQRAQDPAQWSLLCALLHERTSSASTSPRQD